MATDQVMSHSVDIFCTEEWSAVATELRLSRREREIASLIVVHGAAENEIAAQLCISNHTVHTLTLRLFRKAGVNSRAKLVARLFDTRLTLLSKSIG